MIIKNKKEMMKMIKIFLSILIQKILKNNLRVRTTRDYSYLEKNKTSWKIIKIYC